MTSEPISDFPLQWPAGWKRTESYHRKDARFRTEITSLKVTSDGDVSMKTRKGLSIAEATKRILYELERLGVTRDDCVVSTNLKLSARRLPRGDQGEPHDPGAAVYWKTKKAGRRVMAIDAYRTVAGNLGAIAATLEAMRAIERHGGAMILERAFTGFTAIAGPPKWFDVLEVREDATPELIRANYRSRAKSAHPDAGGDRFAWDRLNEAFQEAKRVKGF